MQKIHKSFLEPPIKNKERRKFYSSKNAMSTGFKLGRRIRIYCPGNHFYFIKNKHLHFDRLQVDMDVRISLTRLG
jgi:hypothetical protein